MFTSETRPDYSAEFMEILTNAYVEMNKLHAQPGEKCHMLATSIKFLERQIKELTKKGADV